MNYSLRSKKIGKGSHMKVLICGQYGIICNELIQRLKKESHEIFVITGSETRINEKKVRGVLQEYKFSFQSKGIETILRNVNCDVMIILGICDIGYARKRDDVSRSTYVGDMTNLLNEAKKVGIKRVIYCSSIGVYGESSMEPISIQSALMPETNDMHMFAQVEAVFRQENSDEFHITIIHFPEVYGDRNPNSMDICTRLLEGCYHDKKVMIMKEKEHRVLYAKDAVDALMRIFQDSEMERHYIVPGSIYTEEEILEEVKRLLPEDIICMDEESSDNQGIAPIKDISKKPISYYIKYGLREGLLATSKVLQEDDFEQEEKKDTNVFRKILVPILENIGLFLITHWIVSLLNGTVLEKSIDFYLIYIVLIAITYGNLHGLFAIALSAIAKIASVFPEAVIVFSNYEIYLDILQMLIIGVAVGYMRDWYYREKADLMDEKKYYESELIDITRIYDSNQSVKNMYEKRIISYQNSFAKVYDIAKRLDFWEPQKVIFEGVDVIKELMEIQDVAIYIGNKKSKYFRLAAFSSKKAVAMGKSICIDPSLKMYQSLQQREVYRSHSIGEEEPAYVSGVYNLDKELIAVIMIWTNDLTKINLYQANLLALVVRLVEDSMIRATAYLENLSNQYFENSRIMYPDAFNKMYDIYKDGKSQGKMDYVLLKMISRKSFLTKEEEMDYYHLLESLVRETDFLGKVEDTIYILLANSNTEDAKFVRERFKRNQLEFDIVD